MTTYRTQVMIEGGATTVHTIEASTPIAAAKMTALRVEAARRASAVAVLVEDNNSIYIPRYDEWQHMLPEHMTRHVWYDFPGFPTRRA